MERTFVACKPDAVQRGLIGEIFSRFEKRGFKLVAAKFLLPSEELAKKHYAEHSEKPFFGGLIGFITSGPVFAMVWEGKGVVAAVRKMLGATKPLESEPGTIRGDLAVDMGRNICHASATVEEGKAEIALWFKEEELVQWKRNQETALYE
eukprot:gene2790-4198_t